MKRKKQMKKKQGTKQRKRNKPGEIELDWEKIYAPYAKEQCSLKADIIHQFTERPIPSDVFFAVITFDRFAKLLVDESNLYAIKLVDNSTLTNKKWEPFYELTI